MINYLRGALLLFLSFGINIWMYADDNVLKILKPDGQIISVKLEEKPLAKFVGEALVITTQSQELTFNLDDGSVFQATFINGTETAIGNIDEIHPIINITSYGIEGADWEAHSMVYLYDISGKLLSTSIVKEDGTIKMPILKKGTYLIKTSISSFKINKR